MNRGLISGVALFAALALLLVGSGAFYTVTPAEQIIVTQFGKPVGGPVTEPGLHFKLPFVQAVQRLDKRYLQWDGAPVGIPTKDKTYIHVNTFARWRRPLGAKQLENLGVRAPAPRRRGRLWGRRGGLTHGTWAHWLLESSMGRRAHHIRTNSSGGAIRPPLPKYWGA